MRDFFKAYENFFLKGFDFSGRANRLEYWAIIPVVWMIILALFIGDAQEFWDFLLRRQKPPLNPFYYDSLVVFLLTFIPRLSLTVRRLHDGGKSGLWAKLPFIACSSGLVLLIGLSAAALSVGLNSQSNAMFGPIFAIILAGSLNGFWQGLFSFTAALNAIGWEPIMTMVGTLGSGATDSTANGLYALSDQTQGMPGVGTIIMLRTVLMVATPLIAITLHMWFMIKPSFRDDNRFGSFSSVSVPATPKKPEKELLASYACLFERSPEEQAALRAHATAEVKSLYQTRVLGKREA